MKPDPMNCYHLITQDRIYPPIITVHETFPAFVDDMHNCILRNVNIVAVFYHEHFLSDGELHNMLNEQHESMAPADKLIHLHLTRRRMRL